MFTVYADASGHRDSGHTLTVGSILAPMRNWTQLSKQGRLVAELVKLERRHAHYHAASTVLLRDWREANQSFALAEAHATPYALAAFSMVNKCMERTARKYPNEMPAFIFEDGDKGRGDLVCFMDWVREIAGGNWAGISPVFRSKALCPLQACDIASWLKRHAVELRLGGRLEYLSPHFVELMKMEHQHGVIDADRISEHCSRPGIPTRAAWEQMTQRQRSKWKPHSVRRRQPLYGPSDTKPEKAGR